MKKQAVSFVIPVYNEEENIDSCLKSVLSQTFKPIEVIIVDDGSTDSTVELAGKYPVKILKQDHKGPGAARNLGVKKAKGGIIVLGDADNYYEKDFVERLIKPILKGSASAAWPRVITREGENIWSKCWSFRTIEPVGGSYRLKTFKKGEWFGTVAILKSEFEHAGGFDPSLGYCDDKLHLKRDIRVAIVPSAIARKKDRSSFKDTFIQARWVGKSFFKLWSSKTKKLFLFFAHFFVALAPVLLLISIFYPIILLFLVLGAAALNISVLMRYKKLRNPKDILFYQLFRYVYSLGYVTGIITHLLTGDTAR